jgi:orotate phosphoribosyltransferase
MEDQKRQLGNLLFRLKAIQFGEFRLKLHEKNPDAPPSPIYLMLRTDKHPTNPGPLTDEAMGKIGRLMADMVIGTVIFDRFAGIPEAGEPFADELERAFEGVPNAPTRLYLHKEQLSDSTRRISSQVDGEYSAGDNVLLIDDLITQADSKFEAITALEQKRLTIDHVLVLVDRMQGGREQLEKAGYPLLSVFTLEEMLRLYTDEWFISSDQAEKVREYLAANRV